MMPVMILAPSLNPIVAAVAPAPIAEARRWIAGRTFPADRPLLDLSQAAPAYPPAEPLRRHLADLMLRDDAHGYAPILGLPGLREAYARHMAAFYGGPVGAGEVGITAGCNQAFCLAMMALAGPGDRVILPRPHYFNHDMWLGMLGVEAVPLDVRPGSGAVPLAEDARPLIDARTRAIVLVTPNNPTGAVYPAATIAAFHRLCEEHGLALVLDETYKDFLPPGTRPHALFEDEGWRRSVVHLYSFSKVYALAGHRVGAVTAAPAVMAAIEKLMDCVQITAPRTGQEAALYGLGHLDGWVQANAATLARRGEAFGELLARSNRWRTVSLGAYFAWVEHPFPGRPAVDVARELALEQNLLAIPGTTFGAGQERHIRFAFANVADGRLAEIGDRLERLSA